MRFFLIISGLLILLFGRKLFWFFVAVLGFLAGAMIGELIFAGQPPWVNFLIALCAGTIGVLLAMFAQRIAFALAGFYAGAYVVFISAQSFGAYSPSIGLCIAGGIICAILSIFLMDWAIIVLSSFAGAGAVVSALNLEHMSGFVVFALLIGTGIFVQAKQKG
jgi:hypothetical protein